MDSSFTDPMSRSQSGGWSGELAEGPMSATEKKEDLSDFERGWLLVPQGLIYWDNHLLSSQGMFQNRENIPFVWTKTPC